VVRGSVAPVSGGALASAIGGDVGPRRTVRDSAWRLFRSSSEAMPTPEDAKARLSQLEDKSYERGKKEADIAAHTREQDDHLGHIDQSIGASAKALGRLADGVEVLETKVDAVIAEQARRDAVNAELVKAVATRAAKKLSRIQLLGMVLLPLIAMGSLAVAILQALAAHHP
jgi:septal ring factor EnvC (AmiA/AmiB activator)